MASQSSSSSATFVKPLQDWIGFIIGDSNGAPSSAEFVRAIPDLLHDLKLILMVRGRFEIQFRS